MPTIHPGETHGLEPDPTQKRSLGEDPVPARGHSSDHVPSDFRTINGWGADLDHRNRPSYPKELPSDVMTARGPVTARQVPLDKVHVSNEHPDLTPVFGNVCPPKGLSGMLRDYAFEFGEATNRHWMTLMLADRVDVIEHLVGDVFRGKPDRYIKEKGWTAHWKYAEPEQRRKYMYIGAATIGMIAFGVLASRMFREED